MSTTTPDRALVDAISSEIRKLLLPRLRSKKALALLEDLIEEQQLELADEDVTVTIEAVPGIVKLILQDQLERRSPNQFQKYVRSSFGLMDRWWHWRQIRDDRHALEELAYTIEDALDASGACRGASTFSKSDQ